MNSEVAAGYRAVIGPRAHRVLLQGVTPELADVGGSLVAIDQNPAMVATIWPGDTARRRAVVGNWFDLPFRAQRFDAAIGDAGLSILAFPASQARIFAELERVLRPGGVVAMRVFRSPEGRETAESLHDEAFAGRIAGFQAFKLRLAMSIVASDSDPNVPVRRIREAFELQFPDRDALSRCSGWSLDDIATIDLYEHSAEIYSFPTERQLASVVPSAFTPIRFVPVARTSSPSGVPCS